MTILENIMKTSKGRNFGLKEMSKLLLLLSLWQGTAAYAQDSDFDLSEDYIESDQLEIDGDFARKVDHSKSRRKLEQRTNNLIDKKIENIRTKHERALQKDLGNLFNGQPLIQDNVQTQQAAVQKVSAPLPKREKILSFTPYAGVAIFDTDAFNDSFETKLSTGFRFDIEVHKHVSIGMGFQYSKTEVDPFDSQTDFINTNGFNNNTVYDYGTIEHQRLGLSFNGKFLIVNDGRFKPYVGLGLGFVNNNLEYSDDTARVQNNNGFFFNNNGPIPNLENAKYDSSVIEASLLAGSDFYFNDYIGMNLEFSFMKALNGGDDEAGTTSFFGSNQQQDALDSIGRQVEDANVFSITGGLVVRF